MKNEMPIEMNTLSKRVNIIMNADISVKSKLYSLDKMITSAIKRGDKSRDVGYAIYCENKLKQ